MLKWKKIAVSADANEEKLEDILAGMSGKNRVIKYITIEDKVATDYLRVYRDAEQIVDIQATQLTDNAPFLLMDLPLAEGQLCKVGHLSTSGTTARVITIGYEESS